MIARPEIDAKAGELGVHVANVQRDCVFGWLSSGLLLSRTATRQRPTWTNDMKAFISSTAAGLVGHRKAVIETLKTLNVECSAAWLPGGVRITDLIQSEIASSDVVVAILGYQYGTMDSESGRTWVEREIEMAKTLKKPVFAFLASEEARFSPAEIDPKRSKVYQLRQHVMANYTVMYFTTPSDLAAKVAEALSAIIYRRPEPKTEEVPPARSRSVLIVRLFLSSPGDVARTRLVQT